MGEMNSEFLNLSRQPIQDEASLEVYKYRVKSLMTTDCMKVPGEVMTFFGPAYKTTTTDRAGYFSVWLLPGRYTL